MAASEAPGPYLRSGPGGLGTARERHTSRVIWNSASDSYPPADVVEAVNAVRQELGTDADIDRVIHALRARNLGFLKAIMALRAIKGVPLPEAKELVHLHPAYADTLEDREESWKALHEEALREADRPDPLSDRRTSESD